MEGAGGTVGLRHQHVHVQSDGRLNGSSPHAASHSPSIPIKHGDVRGHASGGPGSETRDPQKRKSKEFSFSQSPHASKTGGPATKSILAALQGDEGPSVLPTSNECAAIAVYHTLVTCTSHFILNLIHTLDFHFTLYPQSHPHYSSSQPYHAWHMR
jgi:hypothetical protein